MRTFLASAIVCWIRKRKSFTAEIGNWMSHCRAIAWKYGCQFKTLTTLIFSMRILLPRPPRLMCECRNDRWFREIPIGIDCQHWCHPNRIQIWDLWSSQEKSCQRHLWFGGIWASNARWRYVSGKTPNSHTMKVSSESVRPTVWCLTRWAVAAFVNPRFY